MARHPEVLVIGSGVAGLTFALHLAERAHVRIITKKHRADSNTNYAQGGIAAVMDASDSFAAHARDTMVAGAGLCHRSVVEMVVREGPDRVRELIDWGVEFTHLRAGLSLAREGGHSHRRIVHAQDRTGRAIEKALLEAVAEHPSIEVLDDHIAVDLLAREGPDARLACVGAGVLDEGSRRLSHVIASVTLLATGGLGRAYRHTTNPAIATGDGVAMAYRAGAAVGNLEFMQFHPTALYPAEERAVLVSEAVRGEGAVLRRRNGDELLTGRHTLRSLAPRDIVARAIDEALKESGDEYVLLDASPIPEEVIESRFPNILADCLAVGIDMRKEPVPVVPAAHYACGGVWTDRDGRTSLAGLYAVGEVACTGLHGANRLASNSLLEAVVYSRRAAVRAESELRADSAGGAWAELESPGEDWTADAAEVGALGEQIRAVLWEDAGIVRSDARLADAAARLSEIGGRTHELTARHGARPDLIELRNLADVARLLVRCARARRESRGLHDNVDHPYRDNERCLRDSVVRRAAPARASS